ncbi:hypothetical protein SS1G_05233 [Sclerotinia sclerotiorum 1980 UF-70]|uniref:Uncharacterized protein n=1 Tax=Sclerotinia sclerotiorum (strain ATCC 18683 / 1980 / Ss-1) TaxID=665079 RepID=A7EIU0_SCLS1|nr:hypothetical protein SS1G_05233 [Sclerotinia sclerotiorum 1980 UF-70]EDO02756.1 hypothetical protein SS1G_05233 [Sclerotinia sclerotiorum 1980 UF-70]
MWKIWRIIFLNQEVQRNRVYDFQRALYEDPKLIGEWFRLVSNMRAKYSILDCDFYNFDETGFMMSIIYPGIVAYINHISKIEFFAAFKAAYQESITAQNMKSGFRGTGLIPFNPEAVLSKLDIRIHTSTPPPFDPDIWISQTPHNPTEALSQSTLVKSRITRHQSSSPTPIFETVLALTKGIERLAHENTLLNAEIRILRKTNIALNKR